VEQIKYVNEHLLPGQIGHFLILLGFVAALMATISYFFSTQNQIKGLGNERSWRNIGRVSFGLHGLSVLGIMSAMFYVMINKHYEYWYAFEHVSNNLSMRYIFSAFWEGQEGSFLLWMFWHVILGTVLIFRAKEWEAPTLAVIALVETFLATMILGLHFGPDDIKIGSSPLVLVRDVQNIPLFSNPEYIISDGQGLNALLQNYWMTIHPPTLFLGFASTVVPFAYAIAGLWTNQHKSWLKPVLPWALFSAAILGLGILMGGAWAYEALSFGGYWAWDPVENMSLVPWLILLAGIHTALVSKNTGYSIKATYLFMMLTFVMIVYSTFLTRSGVLGDTSVHAFTDMGLEWQLVVFLVTFLIMAIALLISRRKSIPSPQKEESAYSREFWLFIGSLVLIFSSVLITFTTSIPVYNKVAAFFNPDVTPLSAPEDVIAHYNKYQLWIAVLISTLSAMALFLRYKDQKGWKSNFLRKSMIHLGISALVAAILTLVAKNFININAWQYVVLMWSSLFGVIANSDYLIAVAKGNIKISASPLAHIGFAVMILGSMTSGLNKDIISAKTLMNVSIIEGFAEEDAGSNVLLRKNLPTRMGDYLVTYRTDTVVNQTRHFEVDYQRLGEDGSVAEEFTLEPNVLYDRGFTKIEASNPSTKHYIHRDIFTHISALPKAEMEPKYAKELEDSLNYVSYEMGLGDTTYTSNYYVIFDGYDVNPINSFYRPQQGDIAKGARLIVKKANSDTSWTAMPISIMRGNQQYEVADKIPELKFKVKFAKEHFAQDSDLKYGEYTFQKGVSKNIGAYKITFEDFEREIDRAKYGIVSEIAVGARMRIQNEAEGIDTTATPIFYIQGNQQLGVPEEVRSLGLKFQFAQPNPETGDITVFIADKLPKEEKIIVEIAENALHDYIVLQAIVFPGINLFWFGSLLMLLGLAMGMWQRYKEV
jgi:cytochrome c-type biogenesis protein CcmF